MTELLPIVFARGQNESVDPRLAAADVHVSVQNIRWRKDGRPAKKYGLTAVTTSGLAASGFNTQPVNAITQWNGTPVLAIGSCVRQLYSAGWTAQQAPNDSELSHFGPGERDIVARDESSTISNPSSASLGGVTLHVWDNGTNLYYSVKNLDGAVLATPRFLFAGTFARCIVTTTYIYVLSKNGTTLDLRVFDPTTLTFTAGGSPGTLDSGNSYFDACGRGSDFVIIYQSTAVLATLKLFTAVLVPVLTQAQTVGITASPTKLGVAGSSASLIFAAAVEPAGRVVVWSFNNGLTANLGGTSPETDANNNAQPGLVLDSVSTAVITWGGFVLAGESSYMRTCRVNNVAVVTTSIATFYGVSPVSKPFIGPAYSALTAEIDGPYVWVATHNADNGSTKWDSQRAYLLVKFHPNPSRPLRRQMHVPNAIPSVTSNLHLSDVLALGTGYGYLTSLLNAVRFGGNQTPVFGLDTVTARSIYESVEAAARDVSTAGRVLQFSGGSLFELNGAAEETGFSNFPVIESFALAGGGGLTPGSTYLYRACYEWIDNQGRRHRSAPSDPVTVAIGANTQVALVMKPLVADSHSLSASGTAASRGVTLHVYRTIVGQSTYHRVTPNFGPPAGSSVGAATVSFNDTMSDANASGNEFIYTDGGVVENALCPPHDFQAVCNGRLWVGGQLDRCVVTASKILVEGEPTQFSDLDVFSVFLPQKCTGLASLDGTLVAFARERIYLITGDGPNDQGIGAFSPPSELPTDVGCINWRSVVETSLGVLFQGKRGIFLLPRGFNSPVFIGAEVEESLALFPYIVSAEFISIEGPNATYLGEMTVRFVCGSTPNNPAFTRTIVYDLRTGGWSVDTDSTGAVIRAGTWDDTFVLAQSLGAVALFEEQAGGLYTNTDGNFITSLLGTGDVRPFGVAGFGDFCSVVLVGEYREASRVNVAVSVDGAASDTFTFSVTSADAPDGSVYLDVTPKIRRGSAIRVTCYDQGSPTITTPSEGFVMQALFIEYETVGKTKRLAAARRA